MVSASTLAVLFLVVGLVARTVESRRATREAAVAPIEEGFGAEHHVVGEALHLRAAALLALGDRQAARPLLERALAIRVRTFGAGSLRVRETEELLARCDSPGPTAAAG